MKNHTEPKHGILNLEYLEATELKKRAAEDAVKDADYYAFITRPRQVRSEGSNGLNQVSDFMKSNKDSGLKVGSPEGLDGLFICSNDGGDKLLLSDEMLQISLADEVAALAAEPIRIFHVKAPAPWVAEIRAGKA